MKKLIALSALTLATSALAEEPPVPQAAPGEIILEQHTHVSMGSTGSITTRNIQISMRLAGTDKIINTPFDNEWQITEGNKSATADGLVSTRTLRERGMGEPQPCLGRRRLDGAAIGKRTEDGANIMGEWQTRECNAIGDRASWVEREETWWRIDEVNGQKILRPHRREVSSQYDHRRVDYTYIMSTRLHMSLFDPSLP